MNGCNDSKSSKCIFLRSRERSRALSYDGWEKKERGGVY